MGSTSMQLPVVPHHLSGEDNLEMHSLQMHSAQNSSINVTVADDDAESSSNSQSSSSFTVGDKAMDSGPPSPMGPTPTTHGHTQTTTNGIGTTKGTTKGPQLPAAKTKGHWM